MNQSEVVPERKTSSWNAQAPVPWFSASAHPQTVPVTEHPLNDQLIPQMPGKPGTGNSVWISYLNGSRINDSSHLPPPSCVLTGNLSWLSMLGNPGYVLTGGPGSAPRWTLKTGFYGRDSLASCGTGGCGVVFWDWIPIQFPPCKMRLIIEWLYHTKC